MLSGLKVIELASVLAGPSVGQFFAELGAEVIKIENPKTNGDVTRSWKLPIEGESDISAYFSSVNWGKKSVSLDVSEHEGKNAVYELIKEADIAIVSYKPGDDEKLGMDYLTLSAINPKLVYGKITGYGESDNRVGYDAVIQAEAGLMYMNGEPYGNSLKMPVALVDVLAAHHLKEGILLALLQRVKTEKGQCVSVSLMDAAISSLANQATNYLVAGAIPEKKGSQHPNIAPYGDVFTTKDEKQVLLAVGNDKQFAKLCEIIGKDELAMDIKFISNKNRVTNRNALVKQLQGGIKRLESDELVTQLNDANVPCGKIHNMKEVFATENGKRVQVEAQNGMRGIRNFVAQFGDNQIENNLSSPPHFGEHNSEVV